MSPKAAEVMEQAQQLSEEERRELAIEAAWTDEARRRVAEVDSGQVATLANEEALRIIASE